MNLGELAYPDVPADAVYVLPLGATEPHGPHAPLSTDTIISVGICERAAERLEGEIAVLVLPAVAYGVTRYGAAFAGAVSISEETLRSLVREIAEAVGQLVLVNSHFEPEQVETLRSTGLPLLDLTRRRNAERLTEEFRAGSCHAGRYETSLVLADRPELVHADAAAGARGAARRHARRDPRRPDRLRRHGHGARVLRCARRGLRGGGRRDLRDAHNHARRADPGGSGVITHADLPRELNLASWFVDRNVDEGRGERTALIGPGGATSYAELAGLVNRCGNLLRELGVRAGERVLLVLGDSVELVALWYGAQKIGAVTAEAYTFLQPKDYAYYIEYTDAKVVVADATTEPAIREVAGERQVLVADEEFRRRLKDVSAELEPAPTTKDDIALWKFTTGSTGQPKGAVHPVHSPVLSNDWYAQGVLGIREDDVVLPVPKLFFGYARDLTALYPFGVGAAGIVFPERSTPERIFELIAEHRPTILVNVPTMMAQMLNHPDAASRDLSCLRFCTSAGEALPRELHDQWLDTFGVEVLDGIGSSELYHIYISNQPGTGACRIDRRARPGLRGRARRQRRAPRHRRHRGALLLGRRGEDGAHVRRRHGPYRRPLRARRGRVLLVPGRVDDLMKVGGIWVAPAEIEHCLAVAPRGGRVRGDRAQQNGLTVPRAYVVAREPLEERALQDFVRERLSPHKYPREVVFVDDLPKTPSGKLDRKALKA